MELRALEPSDAEALWRWVRDPEVVRWMDDSYLQSLAGFRKRPDAESGADWLARFQPVDRAGWGFRIYRFPRRRRRAGSHGATRRRSSRL